MRTTGYVHERNLVECVQRGVISAEQMEQVLAVTRSMARADGEARPDFAWVSGVYALCVAGAIGAAMTWFYVHLCGTGATGAGIGAAALGAGMLAAAAGARRWVAGARPAAALLTAGACWTAWGVGAALASLPLGVSSLADGAADGRGAARLLAWMLGDALVIAAAAWFGLRKRVAVAALPASLALVHLAMTLFQRQHDLAGQPFDEFVASPYLAALGVLLALAARAVDVRTRASDRDAGFWMHPVALACLGFAAYVRVDYVADEAAWFALASGGLVLAGVALERRVYLAAGAVGMLYFVARFAQDHGASDGALPAAVAGSALMVACAAAWLRRRALAAWMAPGGPAVERSVWE